MSGLLVIPNEDKTKAIYSRTAKYAASVAKQLIANGNTATIHNPDEKLTINTEAMQLIKASQGGLGNTDLHNYLLQTAELFDQMARKALKSALSDSDEASIVDVCQTLEAQITGGKELP